MILILNSFFVSLFYFVGSGLAKDSTTIIGLHFYPAAEAIRASEIVGDYALYASLMVTVFYPYIA